MTIRTTTKNIIVTYVDYRTNTRRTNETRFGPAEVYYARADFDKAAKHYGWGDNRTPTEIVHHMGDNVPLFEVLVGSIEPAKVCYL